MASKPRLVYIDLARGVAIALALFSHFMLGSGGWEAATGDAVWLKGFRVITRIATPTFILLFGMSAELAYVRRWATDRGQTVRRLLRRAVQCYAALVAVALATGVGGIVTWPEALKGTIFLEAVQYGNIFAFYVFSLVIALALIPLRRMVGILPTLAITVAWWPIAALLRGVVNVPEEMNAFASRVFGLGEGFGPSALHAQALVVVGMALVAFLRDRESSRKRVEMMIAVGFVFLAAIAAVIVDGPLGAASGFTSAYRATNSYGYYGIGGVLALGVLVACWLLSRRGFGAHGAGTFGRNSMHAFMLGNVILCLFIAHVTIDSFWLAALLSVAYVMAFWLLFRVWLRVYNLPAFGWLRRIIAGTPSRERTAS